MSQFTLYVSNLPDGTTLDDLLIYFQSTKSGGGDVNDESCMLINGNKAVIVFDHNKDLQNVLQRQHEINGCKIEVSSNQARPVPKKRKRFSAANFNAENQSVDKAQLGEIRTIFVGGLCSVITDDTLKYFFESKERSGGGEIEKFDRRKEDVAFITFKNAEVAERVLLQNKVEISGYLLQLKGEIPELYLPKDRRKLFLESIDAKTTKDGLTFFMEAFTEASVMDVRMGNSGKAIVVFDKDLEKDTVLRTQKTLDGAVLKISFPPVCNSVLVSGLSTNTTKDTIEMYFERKNNGGGKIYGDIIHQKHKRIAVVSFCDPDVLENLISKTHRLDDCLLTLRQHYQFFEKIEETSIVKVESCIDIVQHVILFHKQEFSDAFGKELLKKLEESGGEDLLLPEDLAKRVESFLNDYVVQRIKIFDQIFVAFGAELKNLVIKLQDNNVTARLDRDASFVKLVARASEIEKICEKFQDETSKMEKDLKIVKIEMKEIAKEKAKFLFLKGIDADLSNTHDVGVTIDDQKEILIVQGDAENVSNAEKEILAQCVRMNDETVDVSTARYLFLKSDGLNVFNDGLKDKKLHAMVYLRQTRKNQVNILCDDVSRVEDVISFMDEIMFEKQFEVEEDSVDVLKSNKWKEFSESLVTDTAVKLFLDKSNPYVISLIGGKKVVEEVHDSIEEFMQNNTILQQSIELGEGYLEYLSKFHDKTFEEIERNYGKFSVTIAVNNEGSTIDVQGAKEGVMRAEKELKNLISKVIKEDICIEKPRMQEYFLSDVGKTFIQGIEAKRACLIRVSDDKDDSANKEAREIKNDEPMSKLLCSYKIKDGNVCLKVITADITGYRCEVIVNAANESLKHVGGLAKSILDVGGNEIQVECDEHVKSWGKLFDGECFNGKPGRLPCKRLVHAVAPRWDSAQAKRKRRVLHETCKNVLGESSAYKSVAFPALGSGIFGIPKDVCATVMIEAVEEFLSENEETSLSEICFINNDEASTNAFLKKFREKFANKVNFFDNEKKSSFFRGSGKKVRVRTQTKRNKIDDKSFMADEPVPARKIPTDCIVTKMNLKISVVVGDLSTFQADVLVNTTSETLKLDSNPCGKALSNEAGPQLQAECDKKGSVKVGEVAETLGGNLLCDLVFHVVCVQYNSGQGEQVLRDIIKNCLQRAHTLGKKSIAFPAIGTGILGFPHDVAAKIFFEETKAFEKTVSKCNTKEVSFVVYNQDVKSIQAFKDELKKQVEFDAGGNPPVHKVPDKPRRKSRRKPGGEVGSNLFIQVGDDKTIEIVQGDITKETTNVIAHLSNPDLFMGSSVGTAILKAGGQQIQQECKSKLRSQKPSIGDTVFTRAGSLEAKFIAHMVTTNTPNFKDIEKSVEGCLNAVDARGLESVSLPAFGTGNLKQDPEKSAKAILYTVIRFLDSNSDTLANVRILLQDEDLFSAFKTVAKSIEQEEEPGRLKKFVNYFWKSSTEHPVLSVEERKPEIIRKIYLIIYGSNRKGIKDAKKEIEGYMEKQKKKEKLEHDIIDKLSPEQLEKIDFICEMKDVNAKIEKSCNRIILVGHADDIAKVVADICKYFHKITDEEKEKEKEVLRSNYAEILSQSVQWCFQNSDGEEEDYDKKTNAIIEDSFSKKESSVMFMLDGEKCEIVFDKMEEKNLQGNKTLKVTRKNLQSERGDILLPDYWDPQPVDANNKEVEVHLVKLTQNDPKQKVEYDKISSLFQQTARRQNIIEIQRVQNPTLFKQYFLKKKSLDEKSGSNEKFLFHGTHADKVNTINKSGLNRSYAGNANGTAFGKGVYFARDAAMSVGYARVNASGMRYMYYARVAVGEYTLGGSSMIVPPAKSVNESYDSTVNDVNAPTIFVLFHDSQYYPEYLITFQ